MSSGSHVNVDIMMLLVWTPYLFESSHQRFIGYYRHSGWNKLCPGRNLRSVLVISVELDTLSDMVQDLLYLQKNILFQLSLYRTYTGGARKTGPPSRRPTWA